MGQHLTDRSRIQDGLQRCMRRRWLQYHAGPHSLGYSRKGKALPLITGGYSHLAVERILETAIDFPQGEALEDAARRGVEEACTKYRRVIKARGFESLSDQGEQLVNEQCSLVAGLAWGFLRAILPSLLKEYAVIEVEQEQDFLVGCSCGLTDAVGAVSDHGARGCTGLNYMTRPDCILRKRSTGRLSYLELKTGADLGKKWQEQWEQNVQLAATVAGTERKLGERVDEYLVLGLNKGRRDSEWDQDKGKDEQAPKQQNSIFCYGWLRPGVPPFEKDEWRYQYEYFDDQPSKYQKNKAPGPKGFRHTLTKDFQKVPLWAQPEPFSMETWVREMPEAVLAKQFNLVGPFSRPTWLIERYFSQVAAHEADWLGRLWRLHGVGRGIAASGALSSVRLSESPAWAEIESSSPFQDALDREVPQSWNCYDFKGQCSFIPICFQKEGWQDPLGSGIFVNRRPNHRQEREQAEARGIPVPVEEDAEEEEEA